MFQIGWIDYSREERNKILNIIKLLGDGEALDELGIGVVRDAFSDMLFPGISTLQTRAKYFVLIPYLFQMAEKLSFKTSAEVLSFIRRMEEKLVKTLVENSPEEDGIIGSRNYKNGKTVKMNPSNIYWSGLRTTGILRYSTVSIDSVCRKILENINQRGGISLKTSDKDVETDDKDALRFGNTIFTPIVADYDVMKDAGITLTVSEAEYLKRQFISSFATKNSLMAHMLRENQVYPSVFDVPVHSLAEPLKTQFELACEFAEFIYGAHLLYNIILAEGCNVTDQKVPAIKSEFEQWLNSYRSPQLARIIAITKCPVITGRFFKEFDAAVIAKDIQKAKEIIIARERFVKRGREKLNRPDYFDFQKVAEKGIHWYRLNYRYNTARKIAEDILSALKEGNE